MASSVSLCVGCGKDLTDCSKTRKKLGDDSKASDQATRISVLSAWRELAANSTNLQECSSLDGSQLKMCSSCFNDHDKLVELKKKITSNIIAAAEKLVHLDLCVSPKRPRITMEESIVAKEADATTKSSPSVMVNSTKYNINCNLLFALLIGNGSKSFWSEAVQPRNT